MARWLVVVLALGVSGCSSSDLDDLCKRATALAERRDQSASERVKELFEGWKPDSKQAKSIQASMIRDDEIASYGVFRKLISSKASTAWQCPAIERLMVEPVSDDADELCRTSGAISVDEADSHTLAARLAEGWAPTSSWGTIVHEGLRAVPAEELYARISKSYADETGREWQCPGLEEIVRVAKRHDLENWCELATRVETGPTGSKPIHLRRAKMQQLTGEPLGFSVGELREMQEAVGAVRCPAIERVLGLIDVTREIDAAVETTGGDDDGDAGDDGS
jgi:hypothetical protein